jgi:hypothetical protein
MSSLNAAAVWVMDRKLDSDWLTRIREIAGIFVGEVHL